MTETVMEAPWRKRYLSWGLKNTQELAKKRRIKGLHMGHWIFVRFILVVRINR